MSVFFFFAAGKFKEGGEHPQRWRWCYFACQHLWSKCRRQEYKEQQK